MRIFGENIGIVAGDSSSLATGSIALGDTFQGINFFYSDGFYTSSFNTGSLGSIDSILITASDEGAQGELLFKVSNNNLFIQIFRSIWFVFYK